MTFTASSLKLFFACIGGSRARVWGHMVSAERGAQSLQQRGPGPESLVRGLGDFAPWSWTPFCVITIRGVVQFVVKSVFWKTKNLVGPLWKHGQHWIAGSASIYLTELHGVKSGLLHAFGTRDNNAWILWFLCHYSWTLADSLIVNILMWANRYFIWSSFRNCTVTNLSAAWTVVSAYESRTNVLSSTSSRQGPYGSEPTTKS